MTESIYELFTPLNKVRRARQWEFWRGDDIPEEWDTFNHTGTGSVAMIDILDSPIRVTTGSTTNDWTSVGLHDSSGAPDHFDHAGCVMIFNAKRVTTNGIVYAGLGGGASLGTNYIRYANASSTTFMRLQTKISSTTTVDSSVSQDSGAHHEIKLLNNSTDTIGMMWIDKVLEAISTTNINNGKMHMNLGALAQASVACSVDYTYAEAYNL